ncbi:MAG: peptide chain release factor-like protein [bacterium]|nr:peptide chain release factor-like protein [bacterium]
MFSTHLKTIEEETKITFFKSRGPGGQRKNKKETAVRVYHAESGITVVSTRQRSQALNKKAALLELQKRLIELNKRKPKRILTKLPVYIKEKILNEKTKAGEKKILRKKVSIEESPNTGGLDF